MNVGDLVLEFGVDVVDQFQSGSCMSCFDDCKRYPGGLARSCLLTQTCFILFFLHMEPLVLSGVGVSPGIKNEFDGPDRLWPATFIVWRTAS
jgi:hypothetical protein